MVDLSLAPAYLVVHVQALRGEEGAPAPCSNLTYPGDPFFPAPTLSLFLSLFDAAYILIKLAFLDVTQVPVLCVLLLRRGSTPQSFLHNGEERGLLAQQRFSLEKLDKQVSPKSSF